VCTNLFAGYIELIVLYCISIPLNIIISIFAVQFVQRNRIDIYSDDREKASQMKYNVEEEKRKEKDSDDDSEDEGSVALNYICCCCPKKKKKEANSDKK
jgi:hypothetical protein